MDYLLGTSFYSNNLILKSKLVNVYKQYYNNGELVVYSYDDNLTLSEGHEELKNTFGDEVKGNNFYSNLSAHDEK